ncbi:MAG TPA: family 78 glycoside hydrolase catalytic domain [Clostridiaceae bacterium]|nr:family 78 glycoside hydrolase catalytic domain [Clostridiaceae bacterium]
MLVIEFCNAIESSIVPCNLKCEYVTEPIGIDTPHPRFSWELKASRRNVKQTAWRIIVSSTYEAASAGEGDIWDSEKVMSDQQAYIRFAGKGLSTATRYWWRVMIWDDNGKASAWSDISSFVTGFFSVHDWNAEWFHADYKVNYARKEFNLDMSGKVSDAIVYVAALGDKVNSFQLRLNGKKVGDDVLTPGPTEDFRALYRAYDVKDMLNDGKNVLAMIYVKKVSVILVIKYSNGMVKRVESDGTWKHTDKGPITFIGYDMDFRRGRAEEYNARLENEGWDSPGFNDTLWSPVKLDGFRSEPLFINAQLVGCKVCEIIKPQRILFRESNIYLVDFGQNMSGFVRFFAEGPEGTEITIRYAENINPDGTLDISTHATNEKTAYYTKYTLKGKGREFYQPLFMYTGFRYVEVEGYPGCLKDDSIEACFVHSDVCDGSYFECSDETLNMLQKCSVMSLLSNIVNIPTDCPGRERRGWTADAFAVSEAECINFDMVKVYEKWFNDMVDCQKGFGWIPVELPLTTVTFIDVIWPTACILIPWDVYTYYGDLDFLKKYYAMMKNYVDFLSNICNEEYMFIKGHISAGDWLANDPASSCYIASVYYFRSTFLLSKIADVIGDAINAEKYSKLSSRIKDSINKKYFRCAGDTCYYDNNSQSANAHALFFDIVPQEYKQKVLDSLVAKIKEDGRNTTGFLGTMCLLPALAENGRNDMVYTLITDTKEGSWLYAIENYKLTTMSEVYPLNC